MHVFRIVKFSNLTWFHHFSRGPTSLTCVTGDRKLETQKNRSEDVSAVFDAQHVQSALQYEYVADPNVTNVHPVKGIVSGGIEIRVKGTNLNYVQQAQMVFQRSSVRRRRSVHEYVGVCI